MTVVLEHPAPCSPQHTYSEVVDITQLEGEAIIVNPTEADHESSRALLTTFAQT